jgi:hypothetical protein
MPLRVLRYDDAMLPLDKKPETPLPGSLMEPWRGFGSATQPASTLVWSWDVSGMTNNGLFDPPRW